AADQAFDDQVQGRAFGVVGGGDEVDAVFRDQGIDLLLVPLVGARVIDGDGEAALGVHHLHGRHVGVAVAQEDHPVEGDAAVLVGDEVVDPLILPVVVHPLVDAEQILGLGRVVDADRGPGGLAVFVVDIVGG